MLINDTSETTMSINNAVALIGKIVTTEFPIPVGNNGGSGEVSATASDPRGGSKGRVGLIVQNNLSCSLKFENSQSKREVAFKVGNTGHTYRLNDNGETNFHFSGLSWSLESQIDNQDYSIVLTIAD